jgi:hypothetical protein
MRSLFLLLAIAWTGAIGDGAGPRTAVAPEYAIKAVFLFNLVKYADWLPESPLSDPSKPIVIAVIGDDPFGEALDEVVRDRSVRGRPLAIVRTSDVKTLKPVHVAFISASESGRAAELIGALAGRSVLTVGDTESTGRAGAVVNFVMAQGKVRFDVNAAAAKRGRIELSSQLLKLARRIQEPGE